MPERRLALLIFVLCGSVLAAHAQLPSPAPATSSAAPSSTGRVTAYTLPPDKLEKAHALYLIRVWLFFASTFYSFVLLLLCLRWRGMARLRDWAERTSRRRWVQGLLAVPVFALAFSLFNLPLDMYGHRIGLRFGLSVQGWASWFRDWAVQWLLFATLGTLLCCILYEVLHRSPRRWWFYFWLAVIPIAAFLLFISPEVIDPLFHKFSPLEASHPELVTALQAVVKRGGLEIPRERMFEMKASEKFTGSNAYVTGFGATKRVVVWDTAIQKMSPRELQFVFGHELGHYVLDHVVKGFVAVVAGLLVAFYLAYRIANWSAAKWGSAWGMRGLDDWASLPLLLLIVSVLGFLASPISNAYSRYLEHQADTYGLEVVHGLVPDSSQVAAHAFQLFGEEWLDDPDASPLVIAWTWDHPATPDRLRFALTYDPWSRGQTPQFIKSPPPAEP